MAALKSDFCFLFFSQLFFILCLRRMKQLVSYLKTFYEEEFRWTYFLLLAAFVVACTLANEHFRFSHQFLGFGGKHENRFPINFAFYTFSYLTPLFLWIPFVKEKSWLKNPRFWLLAFFAIAVFSLRASFSLHHQWLEQFKEVPTIRFWTKCMNNLVPALIMCLPVFIWWFLLDRKEQPFYGLKTKSSLLKPYFWVLLCMVPVVFIAGLQPSFQKYYPHFGRLIHSKAITDNFFGYGAIFETSYGFGFIATEIFFRGFMILAFAKFLGRSCILPMAVFYVFIHFGKPPGESISAFFGGAILGIFAYETRSVWGGIIVHLGIAWLMEIVGAVL
jgi:hypothetical protein